MISILAGVAALAFLWWLSKTFTAANPALLALWLKRAGGAGALVGALVMLLRGRIDMAIMLGLAAASLLGWSGLGLPGFGGASWRARTQATPRSVSRVRSALVEMELDHDTGAMGGTVLAGPLAGRRLDSLSDPELRGLLADCLRADPDGARLLEPYLDRRFPGWREDADRHADAGGKAPPPAAMTEQEAYEVLGLAPGATAEEVRRAHRTLMKRLHPDQGGSTYLAARVNQAKDVLLSRHR